MNDSHETMTPESDSREVATLKDELTAQRSQYLRLAADFDNFKKRTRRDSDLQAAAEKEAFIHDLLPALDNLERALSCEQSMTSEQLHQGVQMTLQQLFRLLQNHAIESFEDVGRPFDSHWHEAVAIRHDPRRPDHSVLEVVQRGYRRGDKLFRAAKVIVNDSGRCPGTNRAR